MSFWVLFFRIFELRLSLRLNSCKFYRLDNFFILFGRCVMLVFWFKLSEVKDVNLLILLGICFK